jgi:iron complex transport system substrate-binding protein
VQTFYPTRIVCLSAEAVDILYRLGCGDGIAGVTGFAVEPPECRNKPRVSGFSSINYKKIDTLKPDLIIAFSDVQADAAKELIRRGYTVLCTNQRSVADIFNAILLIGRAVGREKEATRLVEEMQSEVLRRSNGECARRPRVYFEEWNDPMISGIRWVSELIEAAGGADIFPELRDRAAARERVVTSDEIIRRQPEIIIASWCGKKANLNSIRQRPGWDAIPAVQNGCVHEIKSADILQPGPSILKGLRQLQEIISRVRDATKSAIKPSRKPRRLSRRTLLT